MARGKAFTLLALVSLLVTISSAHPALANRASQGYEEIEESIRIFNRAKLLHQEKQYRKAIREYRNALEFDDQNPFVYNSLGLALAAVGSFDEALKAFEQALELNPDFTDVYNNVGMVYAERGERDRAFESFSRAVRNPNYPTPEKALYNMGNLYLEDDNLELALIHFERAVEKEPGFALGYRGLGKVYLRMGEVDQAVSEFEKALEIFDEDTESLFQMAWIHHQRGDIEKAREFYRRVVEVDRFSPLGELALANLEALKEGG